MGKIVLRVFELILAAAVVAVALGIVAAMVNAMQSGRFRPAHWIVLPVPILLTYAGVRLFYLLHHSELSLSPSESERVRSTLAEEESKLD